MSFNRAELQNPWECKTVNYIFVHKLSSRLCVASKVHVFKLLGWGIVSQHLI